MVLVLKTLAFAVVLLMAVQACRAFLYGFSFAAMSSSFPATHNRQGRGKVLLGLTGFSLWFGLCSPYYAIQAVSYRFRNGRW